MPVIAIDFEDGIGVITMTDTAKRNALSRKLTAELVTALDHMRTQDARAVIIKAPSGAKVWSAGYDISELDDVAHDALGSSDGIRGAVRCIEDFPAPVIAQVEGGVYGAACELALVCDMIVATPDVTFAITPAKLGLMYNVSGSLALLNRLPQAIVKEMAFTAQPLTAEWAEQWGIINHIVSADEIDEHTKALALKITAFAPLSIAAMKEEFRILSDDVAFSPRTMEYIQKRRRAVFASTDYQEGLAAFRDKRPPVFRGE